VTFPLPEFGFYAYAAVVVRDYLITRVPAPYVVATLVPNPRPAKLIAVRSVTVSGNSMENPVLARRRNIIWCYDLTETMAVQTAEYVRGYLFEAMFQRGSGIRDLRVVGEPCYFPDPDDPAKTPRAQLTVDTTLRAKVAVPQGS
jgi:hypothetical protein